MSNGRKLVLQGLGLIASFIVLWFIWAPVLSGSMTEDAFHWYMFALVITVAVEYVLNVIRFLKTGIYNGGTRSLKNRFNLSLASVFLLYLLTFFVDLTSFMFYGGLVVLNILIIIYIMFIKGKEVQ